jgi:hypothetical protein
MRILLSLEMTIGPGVSGVQEFRSSGVGKRKLSEESRYYLILTQDLGYAATTDLEPLMEEVSKLLVAYATAIESNRRDPLKFCNS